MKYLIQLLAGWNVPSSVYQFIGADGSLGLKKGEHYIVEMQHLTAWIEARDDGDWAYVAQQGSDWQLLIHRPPVEVYMASIW